MNKPIPELTEKDISRFWSKVRVGGKDDCWEWTGCLNKDGYGKFWVRNKNFFVHRVAYFLHYTVDPGESLICHHCDNPACVNFKHLFLGTNLDNMRDKVSKGRGSKLKGAKHGRAKLTEKDIRDIRDSSEIDRILAEKFNVARGTISSIRAHRIWQHLPATKKEKQVQNLRAVTRRQGVKGGNVKLSENQVRYI